MSYIDSSIEPGLRAVMLSEVQALLPAFLSAATVEREGVINAAIELLGLAESDLRQVLAVHTMLSRPVRELVTNLSIGIRRPITSSVRPRVAGRTVTSGIDWAATARHRATSSPLGEIWVTRPANRIFDIPENRALAWALKTIEERGTVAVPRSARENLAQWGDEIRSMTADVHNSRRTSWLEAVPDEWPGDNVYSALDADRIGFYKFRVANAVRYLRYMLFALTANDVVEAISERYFEPKQDWKLYEIAILMRINRSLSMIGKKLNATRLFHDNRARPFAIYRIGITREIRIWYQTWPPSTGPSELIESIRHYDMHSGGNRPDIVIERVDGDQSTRAIVLELKASTSSSYLSTGFSQLLSYLRDRPALLSGPAAGWLVAPPGSGYRSIPPGDRSLWITSSSDVAEAARTFATA